MPGNQQKFQNAMNQGHSAAWDKEWEQAAVFYRQALQEFPDRPPALANLGMALIELSQFDQAIACYQRAAALTPNDPMPLEKLAQIFEKLDRPSDAVRALMLAAELQLKLRDVDKVVENWLHVCNLEPNHLMARTRLAMIYDRLGRRAEAVSEYLNAASLLQQSGDIAKSIQVVEYCLQIQPGSAQALKSLNLLNNNQPLPKPARQPVGSTKRIAEPKKAPEKLPTPLINDPIAEARQKALARLADFLFTQADETSEPEGTTRRGLDSITRGTGILSNEQSDRTRILLHLGQAIDAQMQGDEGRAAEDLEHAINLGLEELAAMFNLGLLVMRRDSQKALRFLQRSLKNPDYTLASNLLLGQLYLEGNLTAEASAAYLRALCLADVHTVPAHQADELRQLYESLIETQVHNKGEAALKQLCENIRTQVLRKDWRSYLASVRQQMPPQPTGSPPLPLAEMLLETSSGQVVEALAHIRQMVAANQLMAAMEEAFYALTFAPSYLPLHIQIGDLLLRQGLTKEAVDKFSVVADLYQLRGESGQAVRLLQRTVRLLPMHLELRAKLLDALLASEQHDETITQYLELADIYYNLAELDMARQTLALALKVAQKSRHNRSRAVQILYRMADIDMQRMGMRKALKLYEQIRTLEPGDATARAHIVDLNLRLNQTPIALHEAEVFATELNNTGRRDDAMQFLLTVISDHPDRPELRHRLAELYTRSGQTGKAIEQLSDAVISLEQTGQRAAALAAVQMIINLNPPNLDEYREMAARLSQ